jgi:signal transduction histidine kinase/CheY-like chemotaxis protein
MAAQLLEAIAGAHHPGDSYFQQLLEKLPAGAYTCDPEGLITYFNPAAARLWGRAPVLNDPLDRYCGSFRLFSTDGNPIGHDRCWMALALKTRAGYNGNEIVVERPDGTRVTALAHANPLHDESGQLLGAVNVLVDISDRKRAEEALREADRAKDEFLATLAHELRNPLAPIRNAVYVLNLAGAHSPEVQWALSVIERQSRQMARLIDDLMDVARITGGRLQLTKERVELAEVVRAAVETARPVVEAAGHELTVSLPPPVVLDADLTRLAQAVSNVLNNAAKYTDRGGRIWLTAERQGSDAVISVRDTGMGIPAEALPHLFEMFTQADRHGDRSRGGLGIGLALVRRLVEMHGGSVAAHSDGPGLGSEFVIRLPAVVEQEPRRGATAPEGTSAAPAALRVLVVDDNWDAAASLGVVLRRAGHDTRTAHDGFEAVALAEQFRPDVVLLDIGLPKLNGLDVARHIREQSWGQRMVLIATTGWGQTADRVKSQAAGFDHHLVKPIDPATLLGVLALAAQPVTA